MVLESEWLCYQGLAGSSARISSMDATLILILCASSVAQHGKWGGKQQLIKSIDVSWWLIHDSFKANSRSTMDNGCNQSWTGSSRAFFSAPCLWHDSFCNCRGWQAIIMIDTAVVWFLGQSQGGPRGRPKKIDGLLWIRSFQLIHENRSGDISTFYPHPLMTAVPPSVRLTILPTTADGRNHYYSLMGAWSHVACRVLTIPGAGLLPSPGGMIRTTLTMHPMKDGGFSKLGSPQVILYIDHL